MHYFDICQLILHGLKAFSPNTEAATPSTLPSLDTYEPFLAHATTALFTLQRRWYNAQTGLYDSTGWWNAANIITSIADLALLAPYSLNDTVLEVLNSTFNLAPSHKPFRALQRSRFAVNSGSDVYTTPETIPWTSDYESSHNHSESFINAYYDDEGWWAHAWLGAFSLTGNADYLETSTLLFTDMSRSWPTPCFNGGIFWDKQRTYISAISNGLFFSLAARLASAAGSEHEQEYYLDRAVKTWRWIDAVSLIGSKGLVHDGLDSSCKASGPFWTYNQGVIISGLVELAKVVGRRSRPTTVENRDAEGYLDRAVQIARSTIRYLVDEHGILQDICEQSQSCGADGSQFKGVFMRGLRDLHSVRPDEAFETFIKANAASIWASDRQDGDELSLIWSGPFVAPANASTHSSALDALIAAAAIE